MPEPTRSRRPRIATVLREAREANGLSIRQLADASGVDKALISRLESGTTRSPTRGTLNRLAGALHIERGRLYDAADMYAPAELPSLPVYFRRRYRQLPDEAVADIERYVAELHDKYGVSGAKPGEDEEPEPQRRTAKRQS